MERKFVCDGDCVPFRVCFGRRGLFGLSRSACQMGSPLFWWQESFVGHKHPEAGRQTIVVFIICIKIFKYELVV